MSTILVTGSASGLGLAIEQALWDDGHTVIPFDRAVAHGGRDVRDPSKTFGTPPGDLDILVNCAAEWRGDWLENIDEEDWDVTMDTNAKGIYRMTQWALPSLIRTRGTVLNILSSAANMPMRASLAYNASKAAAQMMTRQLARELGHGRYGITVFGVSPNKLHGTPMSREVEKRVCEIREWTGAEAHAHQLASLPAGEETDVETLAEFIAFLLANKRRHKFLAGCVLPYGC